VYEKCTKSGIGVVIFKLYSNGGVGIPLVEFVLAACDSIRQTSSRGQSGICTLEKIVWGKGSQSEKEGQRKKKSKTP